MKSDDETRPLLSGRNADDVEIETSNLPDRRWKIRTTVKCLSIFLLGVAALTVAVLLSFFNQYKNGISGKPLKVLALNTWGMPATLGSKDKDVRMRAIGDLLQKKEFDIYLFSELWMRPDHAVVKSLVPQGDSVTIEYPSLSGEGSVIWLVQEGDFVLEDDVLCEVDGSPFTSPVVGYVDKLILAEGDFVTPDTDMLEIVVGRYVMPDVGQLATAECDGRVLPAFCSGLSVVSRFPLDQVSFTSYSVHGDFWWNDGEYWARKGIGRVRIEPHRNFTVDVFLTHTCAEDYNSWYRERQVHELVHHVQASDADFVVLGGDFNVDPRMEETSYKSIEEVMVNSIEEFFIKIGDWLNPKRATYGNAENTYSNNYDPVLYDYIFHKATGNNLMLTNFFEVPFLKTILGSTGNDSIDESSGTKISLSDHEAVTSHLLLWKHKSPFDMMSQNIVNLLKT